MSNCWPDGALRAFLDRELPQEELDRLAAHLQECSPCSERLRQLSARAVRVLELMEGLEQPAAGEPRPRVSRKPVEKPRARPGRWAAAAAALAALWAALALLTPKPVEAPLESRATHVQAPVAVAAPPVPDVPAPPVLSPPLAVRAPSRAMARVLPRALPRPGHRAFPAGAPRAALAGFLALDDDPIDAGVVMRVALAEGQIQADVLYSLDGRPRAIRLVNEATGK
ncbi:MAG TPA: zf-HC2 domain-containing protein [Bryobacteraceae bacterium]|nr:zf-HC2 domain-containing protein [Bryobacteraceae bacterium]